MQDPQGRALLDYNGAGGAVLDWYAFGSGPNDVLNQIGATTRATYVPDIQGSIVASLDAASGALTRAQLSNFPQWQVAGGRNCRLQGGFTQSVKICKAHCRRCAMGAGAGFARLFRLFDRCWSGAMLARAAQRELNMANELKDAASPYLLQHADNPVHWRPWGAAALREAQAAGKPILLSVGYAACHWCHVMAHESFEDAATAAVMNELFVNIKVDREERPDIDHIYMSALHAFGEQRRLAADDVPHARQASRSGAAPIFPKTPRYGRPAFVGVLQRGRAGLPRRAGSASRKNVAGRCATRLREGRRAPAGDARRSPAARRRRSRAHLLQAIDPVDGGLKGAPKFPNTPILELLWRAGARPARARYATPCG